MLEALHTNAIRGMRSAVATAAAVAVFAGFAAAASAQAQPPGPGATPAPTTATPPTSQGGSTSGVTAKSNNVGHLPVIDIVPFFTNPAYYHSTAQLKGYQNFDVGGTVKIPVTSNFSLSFDRVVGGTIDQPLDRVLGPGAAVTYPGNTRDVILVYRGDLQIKQFTVEVGDSFRHRVWNNGTVLNAGISAQPYPYTVSSTEHHYGYLGLTYATKPDPNFLGGTNFVFNITGEAQNVDHHVAIVCTAAMVTAGENSCTRAGAVGYHDENPSTDRWYETAQSVAVNIPLRPTTTLTVKDTWGALNFYENQPFPWRWSGAVTEQITKRFTPWFSVSMNHQDYHEVPQGQPFVSPNAIHVGAYNVFADFHVDLNQMIR